MVISKHKIELESLQAELARRDSEKSDYQLLKAKFSELQDQLDLTTAHNEELILRLQGLEQTV